jgi:hypothetical protein
MPLKFPAAWRFARGGLQPLPPAAVNDFQRLVLKVTAQVKKRWDVIENLKGIFAAAIGSMHGRSSSESWAETDLQNYMQDAAANPPLFLEALYDSFEVLSEEVDVPDIKIINAICAEHDVPFVLEPPNLVRRASQIAVLAPEAPPSLADEAADIFRESVSRAEQLLSEGRAREAIQEMLWILESIATVFVGVKSSTGNIKGKYFNEIAKDLKRLGTGKTLERAVEWCLQLHGYLSSPTGGGVRHGQNLLAISKISKDEGRLFCNLIMSYVTFLLAEHDRVTAPD